jgi:hypothetical protein
LINFMMQDTILSLGKESVTQFVEFLMKYIPKETTIKSTSEVINIFDKPEPTAQEGGPDDEGSLAEGSVPQSEWTTVQKVRAELD